MLPFFWDFLVREHKIESPIAEIQEIKESRRGKKGKGKREKKKGEKRKRKQRKREQRKTGQ
jgi:hypothetical protein